MWSGRLDACSRRVLTDILRAAAHPDNPARIHALTAAAGEQSRHTSKTLAPLPRGGARRRRTGYPVRQGLSDFCMAETNALHGDLMTAIDRLRNAAHLRPRAAVTDRAEVGRLLSEALSALHGLFTSVGRCLEQALRPHKPHVSRKAVRNLILETLGELDDLAAYCTEGDVYVEDLSDSGSRNGGIRVEVEASLGAAEP